MQRENTQDVKLVLIGAKRGGLNRSAKQAKHVSYTHVNQRCFQPGESLIAVACCEGLFKPNALRLL